MSAATISASTAALISAAVGAAGVGAGIFGTVENADQQAANRAAQQAQLTQEQQAQANQANLSKQEAVLGASGQAQEQTGGSLTDPGTAALTDLLAGYPGYQAGGSGGTSPAAATSTGTGIGTSGIADTSASPGQSSGTGASVPPNIAAILAALRGQGGLGTGSSPTSLSGGNWQTQPTQPQSFQQLANPVV
jgi:hypothetical protein